MMRQRHLSVTYCNPIIRILKSQGFKRRPPSMNRITEYCKYSGEFAEPFLLVEIELCKKTDLENPLPLLL